MPKDGFRISDFGFRISVKPVHGAEGNRRISDFGFRMSVKPVHGAEAGCGNPAAFNRHPKSEIRNPFSYRHPTSVFFLMDPRNFQYMFYGFSAAWVLIVIYALTLLARER